MKNFFVLLSLLLLPCVLMAQDAVTIVKNSLQNAQMGMHFADFQRLHPNAEGDETMPTDAGFLLNEVLNKTGVASIQYYFKPYGDAPLYRIEVNFLDNAQKDKTTKALFGKANHPNQKPDYWLVYKGENDYLTVAFALNEVMTLLACIDAPLLEDDLFGTVGEAKAMDLRICKSSAKIPIHYHASDYANAFGTMMESDLQIGGAMSQIEAIFPRAARQPSVMDFRTEYLLNVNENGLKNVSFIYDNDGTKPLYESIFEFENTDTLRRLAAGFDTPISPAHPTESNTWVLDIGENNIVYLIWLYETKIIIAANLPNTEFGDDARFKLPKLFIEKFLAMKKAAALRDKK